MYCYLAFYLFVEYNTHIISIKKNEEGMKCTKRLKKKSWHGNPK